MAYRLVCTHVLGVLAGCHVAPTGSDVAGVPRTRIVSDIPQGSIWYCRKTAPAPLDAANLTVPKSMDDGVTMMQGDAT